MKLTDEMVGKQYVCTLSEQVILVVKQRTIVKQNDTGEKDEQGAPIMENVYGDVFAGKSCITRDGHPQFVFSELHDGQLREI